MAEDTSGLQPHPLDGCDPDECYKVMMTERTDLIKARRESEDSLIKTIVQISAALIALISGFAAQSTVSVTESIYPVLIASLVLLVGALTLGLTEHVFSSKAYLAQERLVEHYYTKKISNFEEPWANKWVRYCQVGSFACFVLALIALSTFGIIQAGEKTDAKTTTSSFASNCTAGESWKLRRQSLKL